MAESTIQRDVNSEFRQSKRDQIASALTAAKSDAERAAALRDKVETETASGAMTALGNGRYRVNQGWDRGEVIFINTARPTLSVEEIESAIMGDHGLSTTADGRTALYVAGEPAWHSFGQHFKEPLTSVSGVLRASGNDFTVGLVPQQWTWNDTLFTAEDAFMTIREDTGARLGSVGKIYTPLQNAEAFSFLEELFQNHEFKPTSAGNFRDGKRVFITAELPEEMIVDPSGFADHIRQYVAILNSHDGSSPVTVITTPWRVECANTERFALRDAKHKWTVRHTKNARSKIQQATETLGLTTQYYAQWQAEEMELVRTPFHDNQIDALVDQIWGEKPDPNSDETSKRAITLDENRREAIREVFRMERERVGSNAYAAERAITGYVDHYAELRPRGALKGNRLGALAQGIMEETLDEPKKVAHKKLMLLTNK